MYAIEGMKCEGCIKIVKERFSLVPGVSTVKVSLDAHQEIVEGDYVVQQLVKALEDTKFSIKI